jgi:hypothetical protein
MQIAKTISGFHHEIHPYQDNYVMLSKQGGISILDGRTLNPIWQENLGGKLLSYSLIHGNIFYGSTTDTFLYAIDLQNGEVIEEGKRNIFFHPQSHYGDYVLAKSYISTGAIPVKLLGLFNLTKSEYVFTKELKAGRVFELLDDQILQAGISKDFEINCMDWQGNHKWTSNIRSLAKDETVSRVGFLGRHHDSLVFAAAARLNSYFISIHHDSGEGINCISNGKDGLTEIANDHSFVKNGIAHTLAFNQAISVNLDTLNIDANTDSLLDVSQAFYEEDRLFYLSSQRGKIGEYSFEEETILWNLMLDQNSSVLGIRCINNNLFAYDMGGKLYKLQ